MNIQISFAQSNTAVASGAIDKCGVWGHPYVLYNNAGATQNINSGVTVTVDKNRNIGSVNLAGSGGMNFAGGNGITMSGAGGEINCRWDMNTSYSGTIINGTPFFTNGIGGFTIPYSGNYRWIQTTGWTASVSGSFLSANIVLNDNNGLWKYIFYQSQSGTCGMMPNTIYSAPTWTPSISLSLSAGSNLIYYPITGYSTGNSCTNTRMDFTIGNAQILYDN